MGSAKYFEFFRGFAAFSLCLFATLFAMSAENTRDMADQCHVKVYFYPPPWKAQDGSIVASPLTVNSDQATTGVPDLNELDGVAVIVPWSLICEQPDICTWTIIDEIVEYWKLKGKKIILSISTSGPKIYGLKGGKDGFFDQVPEWVVKMGLTYQVETNTIGHNQEKPASKLSTSYVRYWDPAFQKVYFRFIKKFGERYNGNKTISFVRIATGLMGEDSPAPFGPRAAEAPGYQFASWLHYSSETVKEYQKAFDKSQLEFDISFIPWGYTNGSDDDKKQSDEFVDALNRDKIFLAFNGWQPLVNKWLDNSQVPGYALNRTMYYLLQRRKLGLDLGLEAVGPMFIPSMQNTEELGRAAARLAASRFVFFGTDAMSIARLRGFHGPYISIAESYIWDHKQNIDNLGMMSLRTLGLKRCN